MLPNFPAFARVVADSFQRFTKANPLVTGVTGDDLYETYLSAFRTRSGSPSPSPP